MVFPDLILRRHCITMDFKKYIFTLKMCNFNFSTLAATLLEKITLELQNIFCTDAFIFGAYCS